MTKRAKDCTCKEREGYQVCPGSDGHRHTMWCGTVNRRDEENWGSSHYGWPAIDTNEPWHYSFKGGKKTTAEAMADLGEAFKALAGVFLDEATRLLNKMTDWLNARYKK